MNSLKQEIAKNLLFYRKQKKLTQRELAERIGVKHNAISAWEKGTNSVDTEVLFRICEELGVTINDMYGAYGSKESYTTTERTLLKKYRALDEHGRELVELVLDKELLRLEQARLAEENAEEMKVIPLFGASFAAGRGDPDFGNPWEDYEVPHDSPAEFAVRISGNSMEPYLPDGSIALAVKRSPQDGEVAALLLDGGLLVKQVCEDSFGNLYLFSLNRERADADVMIASGSERDVKCFGTVLMQKVELP